MKAYRLELAIPDGNKGIYHFHHNDPISEDLYYLLCEMGDDHEESLPAGEEDIYDLSKDEFFACVNLKEWFGEYLEKLIRFDEVIVVELELASYRLGISGLQLVYCENDIVEKRIIKNHTT